MKFCTENAATSGHLNCAPSNINPKLTTQTPKCPFPWVIVTPVPTTDLGSTGDNDGLAAGKRVRFATYTVAANGEGDRDRYKIALSPIRVLGMRKDGTCGNAPASAGDSNSFVQSRNYKRQ